MRKLNDILCDNKGIQKLLKSQDIVGDLKSNWDAVFGGLSEQLRFGFYKNQILTLYCDNPAWVTEIGHYEPEFIQKINQLIKRSVVKKIKIKLKPLIKGNDISLKIIG